MGMYVMGNAAEPSVVHHFLRSVWGWRPLAEYICDRAPQSIVGKCQYWHSNDGDGLNATDARRLGKWLRGQVACGAAAEYVRDRDAALAALPDEPCKICDGTGIRTDAVGVEMGQPERIADIPGHPRHGLKGWCNGCSGRGHNEAWPRNYSLDVSDIEEFAAFCEASGGFKIF